MRKKQEMLTERQTAEGAGRGGILTRLATRIGIQPQALPGGFCLTLTGCAKKEKGGAKIPAELRLCVGGCRRIARYTPEEIHLLLDAGVLCVRGDHLYFVAFTGGTVTVSGNIAGVMFQ